MRLSPISSGGPSTIEVAAIHTTISGKQTIPKTVIQVLWCIWVIEKIGSAAYKLELPESSLIHPVFHISQLKPFTPNYTPVFSDITKLQDLSSQELEPEQVLERRLVKKGNATVRGEATLRLPSAHAPGIKNDFSD